MNEIIFLLYKRPELEDFLVQSIQKMLNILGGCIQKTASSLNAEPEELYYLWMNRKIEQTADPGSDLECFFHGTGCSFYLLDEHLEIRCDFGPGGRFDAFTMYGIEQFFANARIADELPVKLKKFLKIKIGDRKDGYKVRLSINRLEQLFHSCVKNGKICAADPELKKEIDAFTFQNEDGYSEVRFPEDWTERRKMDADVIDRWILCPDQV